jgi:hypothetical protein
MVGLNFQGQPPGLESPTQRLLVFCQAQPPPALRGGGDKGVCPDHQAAEEVPDLQQGDEVGCHSHPFFGIHLPALVWRVHLAGLGTRGPRITGLHSFWATLMEEHGETSMAGQRFRREEDPFEFQLHAGGSPMGVSLFELNRFLPHEPGKCAQDALSRTALRAGLLPVSLVAPPFAYGMEGTCQFLGNLP